jgi:hypothetical protein
MSVARPKDAIILGGSWRVPVIEKLLDKNFVKELKLDGTFNEASFEREYESKWTGDIESAFFESSKFDKNRIINLPEYKYSNKTSKEGYYIMGVDVGRFGLKYSSSKTLLIAGNSWKGQSAAKLIIQWTEIGRDRTNKIRGKNSEFNSKYLNDTERSDKLHLWVRVPPNNKNVQRLVERRRTQASSKWEASHWDEDIVWSAWWHAGVHKRTAYE